MISQAPANHVSLGAWIRNQWQLDPSNVLGVLQQKRDDLREMDWPDFHACWGEALARTWKSAQAWPTAELLLDNLDPQLLQPNPLAQLCRSAPGWGVDVVRYFPKHRERSWTLLDRWLGEERRALANQVGAQLAGEALLEDEGDPDSLTATLLDRLGCHALVGHEQDTPWMCAWASLAANMDRPEARERSLDLLLRAGADLEAVGPDGRRAIARVRGPQDNVFAAGGWLPEVVSERVAHVLGLLLVRGACWDDLEGRVSMEQWQMILDHPVGRRARLEQLACLENNNADVEQQRQL